VEFEMTSEKQAFTLAEILITLGIIGVVTAITMPTLIANYQKKTLAVQFKKSYSNLQNAINLVNTENGVPYECYTSWKLSNLYSYSECKQFYESFLKKFQIVNVCQKGDTSCRPKYKTKEEVLAEGGTMLNNNCSYPMNGMMGYNLSDGSTIYVYDYSYPNHVSIYLGFDINGNKGPNRWGYDLFYLSLYRKDLSSNTTALTSICELIEKDGQSAEEILLK